jgi:hypothetical protein
VPSPDSLAYIESVDPNWCKSSTPMEHLRAAEALAAERGHPAEALARTADGRILTPAGSSDIAFDAAPQVQRVVAARSVEASQWGLPIGADYVSHHMGTFAPIQDPANFSRIESPAWRFACVGTPGDQAGPDAVPVSAYGRVGDIRITPDGKTLITGQFCGARLGGEVYALFAHDLDSRELRLICRLRGSVNESGELSLSPDGRFLIAGCPMPNLVDVRTGHFVGIGRSYRAATWYPKAGPSCLLAVQAESDHPPWELVVLDLATFNVEHLVSLPMRVAGLQVASDDTIVVLGYREGEESGCGELLVSTDDGRTFESAVPFRGAGGWRRRCTRPRWIEEHKTAGGQVALYAGFEEFMRAEPPDNGPNAEEISWVLDTAAYLIKHRVIRLREHPATANMLLNQLRVLTTLPALFDPEMTSAVIDQVVPIVYAAATNHQERQVAEDINAIAAGKQPPYFTVSFDGN